jgi:hypothetical protein
MITPHRIIISICTAALLCMGTPAMGEIMSDIARTKHNLSVDGPGPVRAINETKICVFCHTPHAATLASGAPTPLWNRELSGATYEVYTSPSLDALTIQTQLDQPGGSSKLCLSCHDGTIALGAVNVTGGQVDVTIRLTGAGDGRMPAGEGVDTGFTRDLGIDLRNDHPISVTYDDDLAAADNELLNPVVEPHIGVRQPGVRPAVPLELTGIGGEPQVQCGTCHDPHIRDSDLSKNIKFLRLNRFQEAAPSDGIFDQTNDIGCLACHDKGGWSTSAHADPNVADEIYLSSDGELRDFPAGIAVWQAGCLNCHDSHTVSGARWLLREGTDDAVNSPQTGGNSAAEETCYQCHSPTPIVNNPSGEVKDIESEFTLAIHMPISGDDDDSSSEAHEITDNDLVEDQEALGKGEPQNRHAECSDCHHSHRMMRNERFNGTGPGIRSAHTLGTNIASGALRGAWGVEPVYGSASFLSLPSSYLMKKGDGGNGTGVSVDSAYVTREYQICLKCHSDYGFDDDNGFPTGSRPNLGRFGGSTPAGTNGLTQYTNQAMEFQAPGGDTGEPGGNHRSWHPVIASTGRTLADRNADAQAFVSPWGNDVGNQTMYCSDCHGNNTEAGTVQPSGSNPWGPHGSNNAFLLKGSWDAQQGSGDPSGLCFKCHDYTTYATAQGQNRSSGFGDGSTNWHGLHVDRIGAIRCSWCHVGVPHGFKNKALLVNLNDVGPEAGLAPDTEMPEYYTQEPYYLNAINKITSFPRSGEWDVNNCGSNSLIVGPGSNGEEPGKVWMAQVCSNPP